MDRPQARLLLRKINQLFEAVASTPGPISRIEQDLLLDYTRQFYAALAADSEPSEPAVFHATPPRQEVSAPVSFPEAQPIRPTASVAQSPVEPVPPAASFSPPAPATMQPEQVAQTARPEVPEPTPAPPVREPEPIIVLEAQPVEPEPPAAPEITQTTTVHVETTVRHTGNGHGDAALLFAVQQARDLSDKLRLSRVDDLSKAMGINERFLTINELFGGDHAAFDHTLQALNDLPSFQQAREYLEQEVIGRYGWLDERKQKKAMVFIQLLQRRYN